MGAQDQLTVGTLDADTIRRARARAGQTGRKVMAELEELSKLGPEDFVDRLGRLLRYPVLSGEQLQRSTPVFEQIPFTEALPRFFNENTFIIDGFPEAVGRLMQ